MSLTIASLTYQNTGAVLHRYMRDTYSWLQGMTIVDKIKGKSSMTSINITGNLLVAAGCVENVVSTELVGKDIELDYYNLAFPIKHTELKNTWLSGFASKYKEEENVYIENLIPYLSEKLGDELRAKVNADILTEATADVNVVKVALAGLVDTPANTYATVKEFISELPSAMVNDALDSYGNQYYYIKVSPAVYGLLASHLDDKVNSYGINVGGFSVYGDKSLTGSKMVCSRDSNNLIVFDDSEDLAKIKIVVKEWLETSYIITGLGFKASYMDSSKIVISN